MDNRVVMYLPDFETKIVNEVICSDGLAAGILEDWCGARRTREDAELVLKHYMEDKQNG